MIVCSLQVPGNQCYCSAECLTTYLLVDHQRKGARYVRWLHAMLLNPLSLLASGLMSLSETMKAYRTELAQLQLPSTDTSGERRQHFWPRCEPYYLLAAQPTPQDVSTQIRFSI